MIYRRFLFIVFLVVFFSCKKTAFDNDLVGAEITRSFVTKHEVVAINSQCSNNENTLLFDVCYEEAERLANKMCDEKEIKEVVPIKYGETILCYLVNYSDGWILISADKRTSPILASDVKGNIKINENNHKGIDAWIDDVCGQVYYLKQSNLEDVENHSLFWDSLNGKEIEKKVIKSRTDSVFEYGGWLKVLQSSSHTTSYLHNIPHLITTKWGQSSPWCEMCFTFMDPFGNTGFFATGCTAVAVSQILYYFHNYCGVPSGFYHTFDLGLYSLDGEHYYSNAYRANWNDPSFYWAAMPLNSQGNNTLYVATLMADVGDRLGMEYTFNAGSSAQMNPSTLSAYGLNCTVHPYNDNDPYIGSSILNELDNNRPVIIVAYATEYTTGIWPFQTTHYDDGHTWIIDGYHIKQYNYTDYYEWRRVTAEEMQTIYSHLEPGMTFYTDEEAYAIQSGLYDGLVVSEQYSVNGGPYWKMNWGYDGQYDSGEYSAGLYPWWTITDGGINYYYRYNRTAYYVSENTTP